MGETIFQQIINKEIPADIVYEDDEILAFKDINPIAPCHILIIPKKGIASMREVTAEDSLLLGKMLQRASEIAKSQGISDDGYRLIINVGNQGGQEVYHLHLHLAGGRQFSWPPG